jgi:GR25 family glycosyltransferase involved in LPS biosynthesis
MFSEIWCLNLDKRINEQERLKQEFKNVGLPINFFVAGDGSLPIKYDHVDIEPPRYRFGYPAWANRPNSYNAFLCFKKILQSALDRNLPTVGLVEDDCTLSYNFQPVLTEALSELLSLPTWDMLYLCANHTWTPTLQMSDHVLKLNGSGGFQFVLIRKNLFQIFLDMSLDAPIDAKAAQLHKNYNCYAVFPNIAIPKPGYSYCEGAAYDNTELYKNKGC